MADPREDLAGAVAELRKRFRKQSADLRRAGDALDALAKKGALESLEALDKWVRKLRDADLAAVGLEDERAALAEQLKALHQQREVEARGRVLGGLERAAAAEGLELTRLTDRPLQVLLAPLVVELDLGAGEARILYARETVETTKLEPQAVLAGREAALDRIREAALPSDQFFDLALKAYRTVLLARGGAPGDRVDLVDLLAPLALLRVDADRWRRTEPEKLTPFPRYLLAYQLRNLGRDRMLEKDGLRLDLGTATGGSTRDKRDVLFVPTSFTEGQYQLSIRFARR